jgi:hypothetical protein
MKYIIDENLFFLHGIYLNITSAITHLICKMDEKAICNYFCYYTLIAYLIMLDFFVLPNDLSLMQFIKGINSITNKRITIYL